MIIKEHHIFHLEHAHHEHMYRKLENGIAFRSDILLCTSTFLEYQKDIIQEGIGNLIEDLTALERPEIRDAKQVLERSLQMLNSSLRAFASKVKQQDIHFDIVGCVQILLERDVIASLIGPSSAVIIRDQSIYYKIDNSIPQKDSCDVFSDFIEGELEQDDQILTFGYPLSQVIDRDDIKEIDQLIKSGQDPLTLIQDTMLTRIGAEQLISATSYTYHREHKSIHRQPFLGSSTSPSSGSKIFDPRTIISQEFIRKHKFAIVMSVLGFVIMALMYNLLRTAFVNQSSEQSIQTNSGVVVITIEDIKKEIAQFQRIDPTSNAKKDQYNSIMEKLVLLESNKRRPDDVKKLKDILITEYNLGFNITPLSKLLNSSLASQTVELTAQDIQSLGRPLAITFDRSVNIAGASSALLGVISNDIKGSLVPYNIPQLMTGCFHNPQKNGFYCVSTQGDIYNVGKAGIETVTTKSGKFPTNVIDIAGRGRGNLFLLVSDPTLTRNNNFIVKYNVVQGRQHEYQEAQPYTISNPQQSGQIFGSGFSSLGIDGNFSVRDRSRKALVQLRRDRIRTNPTLMTSRTIQLFGGDKDRMPFSDNVKVLTFQGTEDVYLFDRTNQTLTVYKSNPTKRNDTFWTTYNLNYQYRVIFDQTENPVIDVAISQPGGKTEAYLLTQRSVIKVNLVELGQPTE